MKKEMKRFNVTMDFSFPVCVENEEVLKDALDEVCQKYQKRNLEKLHYTVSPAKSAEKVIYGVFDMDSACEAFEEDADDFTEDFENDTEPEDYRDLIVMVMRPSETGEVKTYGNCEYMMESFGDHERELPIVGTDMTMVFDERHVLTLGEEEFLIGPTIIFAAEEDGICSLDDTDIVTIFHVFGLRKVMLGADGNDLPAFRLPRKEG